MNPGKHKILQGRILTLRLPFYLECTFHEYLAFLSAYDQNEFLVARINRSLCYELELPDGIWQPVNITNYACTLVLEYY